MLISKLKLNYFGKFYNHEIQLKPGINIIYGDNEAGKTTLHTFIKGMLFGIERMRGRGATSKEDIYNRYLPWDYPGAYSGSMDIIIEDKEYRLIRSFHAHNKSFTVRDLSTGREISLKEGLISQLIPGLTEATFKNTVSIEQLKAPTDGELVTQVRNYVANLSVTRSKEISIDKAIATLTARRKQLDTSRDMAELKTLSLSIEEGIRKEEKMDQLMLQLKGLLSQEQELIRKRKQIAADMNSDEMGKMDQFPAIHEKYSTFVELTKEVDLLEKKEKELLQLISSLEKEQNSTDNVRRALEEAEELKSEAKRLKQAEYDLKGEKAIKGPVISPYAISIPMLSLAFLIITVFQFHPLGLSFGIILLCIGLILHLVLNKKRKQRLIIKRRRMAEIDASLSSVQRRMEELLGTYGVSSLEELYNRYEELQRDYYSLEHARRQKFEVEERKKQLEDNRDLIYEAIMKYMQYFLREEELTWQAMERLQNEIKRRRLKIQNSLEEVNRQYEECKLNIEKIRWELQALEGTESKLLQDKEQYDKLDRRIKDNTLELEAINLALSTIQNLSVEIHDSFGKQLNEAVTEVISEVTGQRYKELKVDEKLDIKLGWKDDYVLLDKLSAGTIDQVYFSLRLAVADLLLGKNKVPLLLDDSFALYDEARVKAVLKKIAQRNQVILFTCHKREEQLLKELGINYHKVDLSY